MKLDRHIIELMTLIEKSTEQVSYTFIPQLIREEIVEIKWTPIYTTDDNGGLAKLDHKFEVIYNEKKTA
jgi:hypothetical protein